jgi:hypothetical protein
VLLNAAMDVQSVTILSLKFPAGDVYPSHVALLLTAAPLTFEKPGHCHLNKIFLKADKKTIPAGGYDHEKNAVFD